MVEWGISGSMQSRFKMEFRKLRVNKTYEKSTDRFMGKKVHGRNPEEDCFGKVWPKFGPANYHRRNSHDRVLRGGGRGESMSSDGTEGLPKVNRNE